jgi:AbrB family looped-hinge helix DNA binding protein
MTTSTVSEKGWVVIPKEMRERYGLKKGSKVSITDCDGIISITPVPDDPVKALQGKFRGWPLTKDLVEFRRQEATSEAAKWNRWT